MDSPVVTWDCADKEEEARRFASEHGLSLLTDGDDGQPWLVFGREGIFLRAGSGREPGPMQVDFTGGALAHRRFHGGGRGQGLARAVGVKGNRPPRILDATAGWGRDAFVLACLGCTVTLLERSPVVARLLLDGVERACRQERDSPCLRMRVVVGDALVLLPELTRQMQPDVIYLDPMFPARSKSALVKKEMRYLAWIAGTDNDGHELLTLARTTDTRRIVVKRPVHAPPLGGLSPSFALEGESTRFDIYLGVR